jgi:hypothetical protein
MQGHPHHHHADHFSDLCSFVNASVLDCWDKVSDKRAAMTIQVKTEKDYDLRTALRVQGLWLSGGMIIVAIQLLRPETTFMQPIYAGMRAVAPEEIWAVLMLLFGFPRLGLIVWSIWATNGTKTISPLAIMILSGGCSAIWLAIAVLFFRTNSSGVSCVFTGILFGLDLSTCVLTAKLAGAKWAGDDGRANC